MPNKTNSRHITPKIRNSGFHETLTNAGTDYPLAVPSHAVSVEIYFLDNTGAFTEGRVGFSGDDEGGPQTVADNDDTFGYQGPWSKMYYFSEWSKVMHLACAAAGTIARGTWHYD